MLLVRLPAAGGIVPSFDPTPGRDSSLQATEIVINREAESQKKQ